jgi:hypothetical protein
MRWLVLVLLFSTGCIATTKVTVQQQHPQHRLRYEVTQEWTRTY